MKCVVCGETGGLDKFPIIYIDNCYYVSNHCSSVRCRHKQDPPIKHKGVSKNALKPCTKCGNRLPLHRYGTNNGSLYKKCPECRRIEAKGYYKKNKDLYLHRASKYRDEHYEKFLKTNSKSFNKRRKNDEFLRRWSAARCAYKQKLKNYNKPYADRYIVSAAKRFMRCYPDSPYIGQAKKFLEQSGLDVV